MSSFKGLINFSKTKEGRIIISIIWGLGLSCIFRKICVGRDCLIYKAPNPNNIINNIYKHDNKCYKYKTISTKCSNHPIR